MRELIPWWGRICAKLVLSRLPAGYATWRGLNLFRHGAMHRVDYALPESSGGISRILASRGGGS